VTKETKKQPVAVTHDPAANKGELKDMGGSMSDDWNAILANSVAQALWLKNSDADTQAKQYSAAVAGLFGISPKDELEGMLAAQMLAAHTAAMECHRRAMLPEQHAQGRHENLTAANKLSRSFAALLDALNRHRGKGQQKVTVEHVHVYEGGQAIVGAIEGGGGRVKQENQPHAITYAPGETLRSEDTEREALPVASDAERPMPDARRPLARRAER
jgi:hypothetical protein